MGAVRDYRFIALCGTCNSRIHPIMVKKSDEITLKITFDFTPNSVLTANKFGEAKIDFFNLQTGALIGIPHELEIVDKELVITIDTTKFDGIRAFQGRLVGKVDNRHKTVLSQNFRVNIVPL